MVSNEVEWMMHPKRYFLLFLFALFLCWLIITGGMLTGETGTAKAGMRGKALSLGSFISPGNSKSNGRLSKGKFLVASRQIRDPRFRETVILLLQHDINGTLGLIINRPTTIKLSDFFPEIKGKPGSGHFTYIGGPVGMNQVLLLIRLQSRSEEAQWIFDDVYVSANKSVLENLVRLPDKEAKFRVYAGYAGWIYGQLEQEILRGQWQVVRADVETIFKKPSSEIWPDLIRKAEAIRINL
jgi:putative transcriptional regulator